MVERSHIRGGTKRKSRSAMLPSALPAKRTNHKARIEEATAEPAAGVPHVTRARDAADPHRRPLPDNPPRKRLMHFGPCICPGCRALAGKATELLRCTTASFGVVRHIRPRLSGRVRTPRPSHRPGPIVQPGTKTIIGRICSGRRLQRSGRPELSYPESSRSTNSRPYPVCDHRSYVASSVAI